MAKIIDSLVEYMLAARSAKLPDLVLQRGKSHLLDTLAAIVSGSTLTPTASFIPAAPSSQRPWLSRSRSAAVAKRCYAR